MGYGATFGILGGHGPLGPPKSAYVSGPKEAALVATVLWIFVGKNFW